MADTKKYLYYGDLLVDELALLTDLADGFASDVNKLSVSNKVKLQILSAGNDIILSGIKGAKPNGTNWEIETGGTPLPLDLETSKYYGYAANLIQKRMKRLATAPVKEEDTKTELPEFTSTQLLLSLRIARSSFGGLGFTTTLWRDLFEDPRDKETGLFGNSKRKAELANLLELLKNDLTNNPYNFEGSAFTDVNDYLKRLDVAINALRNNEISEQDLKKSLFSIGLNYDDWFNNGSGDTYVDENGYYHINEATLQPHTYGSWYNYLNQLNTLKQEAEQKATEEKLKALDALQVYISKPVLKALSLTDLSNKYNGDLNTAISNFKNVNLNQLTQELNDELVSLFLGGYNSNALDDINDDEWELIKSKVATNGEDRSLYRKINGINGIYYDVAKKNLFQLSNSLQVSSKNFLAGLSDKEKEETFNTSPRGGGLELTAADKRDIAASIADLGALVSPGLASGTVAALTASGLRTYNSIQERGLAETLLDWKTWADIGTGALGGTFLLGDASSLYKFAKGFGKLMTLPAIILAFNNVPEAKTAWDKIDSNNLVESLKLLTPQDYHAISSVLIGVLSGKNYLKGNLSERRVIEHSGYTPEQINASKGRIRQYSEQFGLIKTKVPKGEVSTTETFIKAKVNNEDKSIKVTPEVLEKIERASSKAGNNSAKRNESVGKILKEEGLVGKDAIVEVTSPTRADSRVLGVSLPSRFRTTRNLFESKTSSLLTARGEGDFEAWLNSRSTWDLYKPWSLVGTNSNLRRILNNMGLNSGNVAGNMQNDNAEIQSTETPKWNLEKIDKYLKNLEKMELSFLDRNNYGKTSQKIINLGENIPKENYTLADGKSLSIELKDGNLIVKGPDGINKTMQVTDQLLIKQNISKIISDYNNSIGRSAAVVRRFHNDYIESLKKLHREGWLYKQGGKFTDTQIDNFLKQYRT